MSMLKRSLAATRRPRAGRFCGIGLLLLSLTATASAQQASDGRNDGLSFGLATQLVTSRLGGGSHTLLSSHGNPETGLGVAVAGQYDFSSFGVGLELSGAHASDQTAAYLQLALLAEWRPSTSVTSSWYPRVSLGYVRTRIGNISVVRGSLHEEVLNAPLTTGQTTTGGVAILGNGARANVSLEHRVTSTVHFMALLGLDAVRFDTAEQGGTEVSIRGPGWSALPRLAVGLVISPGSSRRVTH